MWLVLAIIAIGAGAGGAYAIIQLANKPAGPLTLTTPISVTAQPSSGGCNQTFKFIAQGSVTGAGVMQYQWEQSDGQKITGKSVTITADDGAFNLSQAWRVGTPALKVTMTFHVVNIGGTAVDQKAQATVNYTCP